jgi:hypothetical protein
MEEPTSPSIFFHLEVSPKTTRSVAAEKDIVMTVAGFEDALASSVHVQITPTVSLPVVSLAGLAILKIFAWQDRPTTDKDALDLYRAIVTYADAGNADRLYDSEISVLEELSFDLELAGAALLCSDAGKIASHSTRERLRSLLTSANFIDTLTECIRISRWPLQPEQASHIHSMLSVVSDHLLRQVIQRFPTAPLSIVSELKSGGELSRRRPVGARVGTELGCTSVNTSRSIFLSHTRQMASKHSSRFPALTGKQATALP